MTNTTKKDRNAKYESERWLNQGKAVVDVIQMLEHLSRIKSSGDPRQQEHLERVRNAAMLVAAHALRPVLSELNVEHLYWNWVAQDKDWVRSQHG